MHHDGSAGCSSNGFVMSASRGTKGEVTWSTCSRNVAQSLDKDCLRDNDGGPSQWNHMDKYDNRPGKPRGCIFARFDKVTEYLIDQEKVSKLDFLKVRKSQKQFFLKLYCPKNKRNI